jgi:Putative DNA-binding domain
MWHERAPEFAAALLDPERAVPAVLAGREDAPAGARFNVYRNNVAHGLIEALGSIFPAVKAQCGEERFTAVARLYLSDCPPQSRLVFEHGRGFAAFLDGFEPARQQMPWLADLARLERAWLDAFHAADAAPLSPEALALVPPTALAAARFERHPAAAVVTSLFAIHDLFETGRAGSVIAAAGAGQACLVSRPALSVEVRVLPDGGATFFEALLAGDPLGEALSAALGVDATFDIPAALAALIQSGAVVRIL